MRALTLVLPHFCNLGMLAEQQRVWMAYPEAVRAHLHVIVVDDCSPKGFRIGRKAIFTEGLGSFRVFRLLQKKRWNWLACRNLGAKMATTEWLLLTDIDHVVPDATLQRIVGGDLESQYAYRFRRQTVTRPWPYVVADQPEYKPHNDTWLLQRSLFFDPRVGGYDERLSGCYGTSGEFRDRLVLAARAVVMRTDTILRYPREIIADASTLPSVYTRKGDPVNDAELQQRKAERSLDPHWTPLHGLIPYELVYDSQAVEAVA